MSSNGLEYSTRLSGDVYREFVLQVIEHHRIESIVETGSYDGLGSSLMLASFGLPFDTMECHAMNFVAAKVNLSRYKNATVHHAYSLDLASMLEFIDTDEWTNNPQEMECLGVKFDHSDPKWYYRHELVDVVTVPREEGLLMKLIDNDKRQLVFLDSSGGTGLMEFNAFMGLDPAFRQRKILMLDDVGHIKHYRSVKILEEQGHEVKRSGDGRLVVVDFTSSQHHA